jgi:hypothetical protein
MKLLEINILKLNTKLSIDDYISYEYRTVYVISDFLTIVKTKSIKTSMKAAWD